jgi:hypothetical protein
VVFGQARFHTHHPLAELVDFFASPGGNLLWDIFLLALGIYVTVWILQRYFDRQEEKRWRPARQDLYRRLFAHAGWLISMLPDDVREGGPQTGQEFGHSSIRGRADPAFSRSIRRLKAERLREAVDTLADNPKALEEFEERLDQTLQPSATILMTKDPGLSGLLADLREWMTKFEYILKGYREARRSHAALGMGTDPPIAKQACVQLKEVIIEADRVRRWLAAHAEGIGPADRRISER